jgi:hypothetical protein
MKRTILAIVLLFATVFCSGQSLVTSTKGWNNLKMDYTNPMLLTTESLRFTGDTVINALVYKRVERSTDEYQQYWTFFGYAREDAAKRVWYRQDASGPEYLFYDFGLQLHDTITAYSINTWYNSMAIQPQLYFVNSIDSMLIGESYRKRINLAIPEDTAYIFEQWIDSTGNPGGLLHNNEMLVGRDSYALLCYFEDGILKYHNPGIDLCYVVTGTGEREPAGWGVTLSPNPLAVSSVLIVKGPDNDGLLLAEFYDITGRKVCSMSFSKKLQLSKKDFQPGLYFYRISGGPGNVLTGRFISE